ncbi:hypothetical protein CR203_00285 [Salipaludibacillus neizhouensis]|uniref:Foldase protein PrsA n=1 Tax=Salipaludibacillus neizhouensis TaxID=885475 RepID=A0A3A9KG45_9BACI|nr:peptidylprolyl isomerase [Salipaludibacillus neizhouensis]RKL68533.1 hypothetical protein CR203_00285 [Salipaludibacillus neizhouensis]
MKKYILTSIISSITMLSACSNESNSLESEENTEELIVATSSGDISEKEFNRALRDQHGENVLQSMVLDKIIESEAKRLEIGDTEIEEEINFLKDNIGATNDEQFFEMMKMQGISGEDDLNKRVINHLVMQHHIGDIGEVNDVELLKEYERGEEVEARHILVEDLEKAEEVHLKLADGVDFGELAQEYSIDPASREDGGHIGSFRRGTMSPPFEGTAFYLDVNEVSEPVQSQFGFHIIEVLNRTPFEDDFEEVKEQLRSAYNDRKLHRMNEKQQELLETVDIEVFDEQFEDLFEQ